MKIQFSARIKSIVSEEKDKLLALASLDNIKDFVPKLAKKGTEDLLPIAFNACVIGQFNKNRHAVAKEEAVSMAKSFLYKQINVEHNRKKVCGVILSAGFSKYPNSEPMTEEEALASKDPFHITLGGVVWKTVGPKLAEYIAECSNPNSEYYNSVSASWELNFDLKDSVYVLKDKASNSLEDGEIVEDEEIKSSIFETLKANADNKAKAGKYNNKYVYTLAKKDVTALGIGLTETPAADVSGILSLEEESLEDLDEEEPEEDEDDASCPIEDDSTVEEIEAKDKENKTLNKPFRLPSGSNKKFGVYVKNEKGNVVLVKFGDPNMEIKRDNPERKKAFRSRHNCDNPGPKWKPRYWSCKMWSSKKVSDLASQEDLDIVFADEEYEVSQSNILSVTSSIENKPMKLSKIQELNDDILKAGTITASAIQELFVEEIKKASDAFEKEKAEKEKAATDAKAAIEKATQDQEAIKKELEEAKNILASVRAELKNIKDQESFTARMAYFDSKYELSTAEREIVGNKVKASSDENFDSVKSELEILLASKAKAKKQEVVASTEDNAEKVVDKAVTSASAEAVIAPTTPAQESFKDKFLKTFKNDDLIVTIEKNKRNR